MDLDRCPKCGAEWKGGDMCRNCRFVPIGAGLDKLPKKKKKRAKRYVEPGSGTPFLVWSFLGLVGFGCFQYKPWKDDWELVRELMGQGRRHSVVGEWEVVKTMTVKKASAPLFGSRTVQKGTFTFSKKGTFALNLVRPQGKVAGKGKYAVTGQLVAINGLASESANTTLPSQMKMKLAWTGPNTVVAVNGGEAIYLRRREKGTSLANLMQMGIKPGNAKAPGQMRGVIATLQQNIDDQSKD